MFDKELIFTRYPALYTCKGDMEKALSFLTRLAKENKKVMVCGNGGSAADSEHIVGELMKGFLLKRPLSDEFKNKWRARYGNGDEETLDAMQGGIKAISLPSQIGVLSAFLNDCEPQALYAQLAYNYAEEGDMLICISTSGNSKNTVLAAKAAKLKDATVVSLTGEKESKLSEISDICIRIPAEETYQVQEYHLPVYHWLCAAVEDEIYGGEN